MKSINPICSPLRSFAGALALTMLGDWLFIGRGIGWTAGAYALLLTAGVLLFGGLPSHSRITRTLLTLTSVLLALRCFYAPNILCLLLLAIAIPTLGLTSREGWTRHAAQWAGKLLEILTLGWGAAVTSFHDTLFRRSGARSRSALQSFGLWFIPLLLALVFLGLFAAANPVISRWLASLFNALAEWRLPKTFWSHIAYWTIALPTLTAWFGYRTRCGESVTADESGIASKSSAGLMGALLSAGTVRRALILFNAIFAVQTILDILYLWGGASLPDGMTYAEYAHRGAYPLVAAALLAGGFALAAFHDREKTGRMELILVTLWLLQTLLLVCSSAWRLWLYVGVYALTRMRFAAAVWMLLIALGLVWILIWIAKKRSAAWLIDVNTLSLFSVLFAFAIIGADAHIAAFNVRHCQETLGQGHEELDAEYLVHLGPESLPHLQWIIDRHPFHENTPDWRRYASILDQQLDKQLSNWRGWTLQRARLGKLPDARYLNEEHFTFGRVIEVGSNTLAIEEYDFTRDIAQRVEFTATPQTEFGNIPSLSELKPVDHVVMDYFFRDNRRILTTLVKEEESY